MIYVHGLRLLTPKAADIESMHFIRDLKRKTQLPLTADGLKGRVVEYFVSETDRNLMARSLELLPGLIEDVRIMHAARDPEHEIINVERTIAMLSAMEAPLRNNLAFAGEIAGWQERSLADAVSVLDRISSRRSPQERAALNQELGLILSRLLRNDTFVFNAAGIVDEEHIKLAADLGESMSKGFLFHFTVEDELKKRSFEQVKYRLAPDKLAVFEGIASRIREVKGGIDPAYAVNMRFIEWSLVLYAYARWLGGL